MTELIFTLGGLVLGAAAFALGFFVARAGETPEAPRAASDPAEAERLRELEEERRAFRALMGYNADVAYGAGRAGEETP